MTKRQANQSLLIKQLEDTVKFGSFMQIKKTNIKHKTHTEQMYKEIRAKRQSVCFYLTGLGSRLWFGNDLHCDDAVGFFLYAKMTL